MSQAGRKLRQGQSARPGKLAVRAGLRAGALLAADVGDEPRQVHHLLGRPEPNVFPECEPAVLGPAY
jgi:hypothetical protein